MINTDIKEFIEIKNKEHLLFQNLLLKSTSNKEDIVYQNFNYTSSFLIGKLKKIEFQIKGAINIIEKVEDNSWNLLNLSFIEKLAEEEFIYHNVIDSKYYNILSEKLLDKVIISLKDDNDLSVNLKRLNNLKNKLIINLRKYGDINYKKDWIRDRYFELASFIDFNENLKIKSFSTLKYNSIYDIVVSGEKTIEDMKSGGIHYDVLNNNFNIIKKSASKEVFYLMSEKKEFSLQ